MAIVTPILVLALGLILLGSNASTGSDCGGIDILDASMQAVAIALVTYVTYITRRLDKESKNGGQ